MVCTSDRAWSSRGDPVIDRTVKGGSAVVYVLSFNNNNNNKVFVKYKILSIFCSTYIAKKVKECSSIFEKQKKLLYFISGSSHPIQPCSDSEANKHTNSKGGKIRFFSFFFSYWWEDQAILSDLFLSVCLVFKLCFVKILKIQHDAHLC